MHEIVDWPWPYKPDTSGVSVGLSVSKLEIKYIDNNS